jgi:hypothetical protein
MSEVSRRGFLGTLIGGLAAGAAVRTWPFRTFSFPSEITAPQFDLQLLRMNAVEALELETFAKQIPTLFFNESALHQLFACSPPRLFGSKDFRIPFHLS